MGIRKRGHRGTGPDGGAAGGHFPNPERTRITADTARRFRSSRGAKSKAGRAVQSTKPPRPAMSGCLGMGWSSPVVSIAAPEPVLCRATSRSPPRRCPTLPDVAPGSPCVPGVGLWPVTAGRPEANSRSPEARPSATGRAFVGSISNRPPLRVHRPTRALGRNQRRGGQGRSPGGPRHLREGEAPSEPRCVPLHHSPSPGARATRFSPLSPRSCLGHRPCVRWLVESPDRRPTFPNALNAQSGWRVPSPEIDLPTADSTFAERRHTHSRSTGTSWDLGRGAQFALRLCAHTGTQLVSASSCIHLAGRRPQFLLSSTHCRPC